MDATRQRPNTVLVVLAVPLIAGLAVLATSLLSSDDDASTVGSTADSTSITIENFEYAPGAFDAKPGAAIEVVNRDDTVHTVTADDETTFDTGDLAGGGTATITVEAPGTYRYFCAVHNYMKGVIRVQS